VSTYLTSNSSQSLIHSQTFDFTLAAPGPNPARQDAPHPHEAIVDPTGNYVLVPDLGADLVRVFQVDKATKKLTPVDPLVAAPGSGPRHAVFGKFPRGKRHRDNAGQGLFMYLVAELANSVTVYEVNYLPNGTGLKFEEVQVMDTFAGKPIPPGAGAGEIALSVSQLPILHPPAS
jgi:6-phosphogluconolactonase (cycloisomerase 2 family)